jgi:hypothetical protein
MMIWTSGIALGLGVLNGLVLIEPPPLEALRLSAPKNLFINTKTLTTTNRMPATSSDGTNPPAHTPTIDLELPCSGKTTSIDSSVKQIRLTGHSCENHDLNSQTSIVNETNGYTATVFLTDPRSFTSDYISVAEGNNTLKIRLAHVDGSHSDIALKLERSHSTQFHPIQSQSGQSLPAQNE